MPTPTKKPTIIALATFAVIAIISLAILIGFKQRNRIGDLRRFNPKETVTHLEYAGIERREVKYDFPPNAPGLRAETDRLKSRTAIPFKGPSGEIVSDLTLSSGEHGYWIAEKSELVLVDDESLFARAVGEVRRRIGL